MKRFSAITTTQIARICGVSQGTVDRALHGRAGISPKTRAKILEVASKYDYTPRVSKGDGARSMLIGAVLFDLYNEYFSKLAMSLVSSAKRLGYSVIFAFSDKDIDSERGALEYFNFIGVDGIVLFTVGSDDTEYGEYLKSLMKPLVTVGNRLPGIQYVGIDDAAAMSELTRKMLDEVTDGDIGYFAPILRKNLNTGNAQLLRLQGFEKEIRNTGRTYRIITDENELTDSYGGIICATDYYALRCFRKLGFDCTARVAGFDNTVALRDLKAPVLTVEYSTDSIADAAIDYILGGRRIPTIKHSVILNKEQIANP